MTFRLMAQWGKRNQIGFSALPSKGTEVMFAIHFTLPKKCLNSFPVRDNNMNLRASPFKVQKPMPSVIRLHPKQRLHNSDCRENSSLDAAFLSKAPSFSAPACYLAQSLWSLPCDIYTLWALYYLPVRLSTHGQIGLDTSGFSQLATHQGPRS